MILQYCSDLHLEFSHNQAYLRSNPLKPKGDILILAGDVIPFHQMDKHEDFFSFASDHFSVTYWVPGNHEYYHTNLAERSGLLEETIRDNVFLVNNVVKEHDRVKLILTTLWSSINPVNQWQIERSMSDFQVIRYGEYRFSVPVYNKLHLESLNFVQSAFAYGTAEKTVVITHHVPTFQNYPEIYKGDVLNEAFAVNLDELIIKASPDYWIYGHHHNNTSDFNIGQCRMLTNQLGYVKYGEHEYFCPSKCIYL